MLRNLMPPAIGDLMPSVIRELEFYLRIWNASLMGHRTWF